MKISVALATYNGARFLEEQLNSFMAQTRPPDEVVITDDCSQDGTLPLLHSFSQNAPFSVHISTNPHRLGTGRNFSKALSLTTGDIVCLSDQDDVWFTSKIATIERTFNDNSSTQLVINNAELTDERLVSTRKTRIGQIGKSPYRLETFVQGSCTSLRRSFLRSALPLPVDLWTHDSWLHAIALLADTRLIVGDPLQYFRRHSENQSHAPTSNASTVDLLLSLGSRAKVHFLKAKARHRTVKDDLLRLEQLRTWWQADGWTYLTVAPNSHGSNTHGPELLTGKIETGCRRLPLLNRSRLRRGLPLLHLYATKGSSTYGGNLAFAQDILVP